MSPAAVGAAPTRAELAPRTEHMRLSVSDRVGILQTAATGRLPCFTSYPSRRSETVERVARRAICNADATPHQPTTLKLYQGLTARSQNERVRRRRRWRLM
jgi:hypothetical protein